MGSQTQFGTGTMRKKSFLKAAGIAALAAVVLIGCGGKNHSTGGGGKNNDADTTYYVITFDPNGGTVEYDVATTGVDGRLDSLPTTVKAGHDFDGWFTAITGGTAVTDTTVFTKDTTIYARWTAQAGAVYTITLDANGGTVVPTSTVTNLTSGTVAVFPTPSRSGYTFNGWFTEATGGTAVTTGATGTVFTENTTIYAHWTPVTYSITYDLDGGTVSSPANPASYTIETATFTLKNPTKGGDYTFAGWTGANGTVPQITVSVALGSTGNKSYTANWTANVMVSFDANGGSLSQTATMVATGGTILTLPTPSRNGYIFVGWFTAAEGGTSVTTSTVFTAAATIYAQWTRDPSIYMITFDANGGTVTLTSITTRADGRLALATLPTPTRDGYAFSGWFTAAKGGTAVTTSTVFTADATIYAQWVEVYTIMFNANGGTVTPASGTTNAEGKLDSLPTPTRDGYTFNGWTTLPLLGTEVTLDRVYTANMIIHARWTQD